MIDEVTALRDGWDAPDAPRPATRAAARAALLDRAAIEPGDGVVHVARRRARRRRVGVRVAAVGAAAAVIAAGIAVLAPDDSRDPLVPGLSTPAADAEEVLEQAAVASEAEPAFTPPRDDQWIYIKSRNASENGGEVTVDESWQRADGGGRAWIDEAGTLQTEMIELPQDRPGRPKRLLLEGWALVKSLPSDPADLQAWAHERAAENWENGPRSTAEEEIYLFFNHLLRGNVMPPELEAAVYRVLKLLPGLTVENVDVFGRQAISIAYESDWLRDELLLDPQTYEYVGERSTVTRDATISPEKAGNATGAVHQGSQVLSERLAIAVVDAAGERP